MGINWLFKVDVFQFRLQHELMVPELAKVVVVLAFM
jgi:hypothetical protein